jgi:hypothetical protein
VITQTEEFGADEEHLPSYGTPAVVYGLNDEGAEELAEGRERGIRHFLYETCDNSSTPVTDDEDVSGTGDTVVIPSRWALVDDGSKQQEPPQEPGFSLQVGHVGAVEMRESVAPSPWSSTWVQARAESEQQLALEERFKWMTDADLQMLTMGLEPYPWEEFAEAISRTQEWKFQAIEQRACEEEVMQKGIPPGPDSLVWATLVVRSHTVITVLNMVRHCRDASQATSIMLCRMEEALPEGAHLDLIISTEMVLAALGTCADILTKGWDMEQCCQVQAWRDLMTLWKDRQLHAVVRKVDEDGMDADNSPFLKLSMDEAIHTVRHVGRGSDHLGG